MTMVQHVIRSVVLLSLSITPSLSTLQEYDFTVRTLYTKCFNGAPRIMTLANGQFPGPLITANVGDTVRLNIMNLLPEQTLSIHHHGLHMKKEPYQDGAKSATQCTLPPHMNQTYEYEVRDPGTHWWHAHNSMQGMDGLWGPIVVYDKNNPEEKTLAAMYDEEVAPIMLSDWFAQGGQEARAGLDSEPFVWVGNPYMLLIDGKGAVTTECEDYQPQEYFLTSGKTYRLRLINSGSLIQFNFAIAGHNLTIVEADGTILNPLNVSNLDIGSGQRYSVLVKAGEVGVYEMSTAFRFRDPKDTINGLAKVIISNTTHRGDAGNATAMTATHPLWDECGKQYCNDFDAKLTTKNVPLDAVKSVFNATPDLNYTILGTQNRNYEGNHLRWALNNVTLKFNPTPIITNSYLVAKKAKGWSRDLDLGPGYVDLPTEPPEKYNYSFKHDKSDMSTYPAGSIYTETTGIPIIRAKKGQLVQIILQNAHALNAAPEVHPWHLHGHNFYQVGQGSGNYDPSIHDKTFNLKNPKRVDTLEIYPTSWVAIRFIADNPGAWGFHCHISSHFVMGMGLYLVTSPDLLPEPTLAATSCLANSLQESVTDILDLPPGNGSPGNGIDEPKPDPTSAAYGVGYDSFMLVMSLAFMGTIWFV